ncbi:GntR family transcriptional regulator [Longimicrobium terrae]|nr:GntR family transcriptional regulator [Longimicrobium terrae]
MDGSGNRSQRQAARPNSQLAPPGAAAAGDRLPSIRALWREMGVDHRVVAQAYRILEDEGLVEVRGRSGVYLAPRTSSAARSWPRRRAGWPACWWRDGSGA